MVNIAEPTTGDFFDDMFPADRILLDERKTYISESVDQCLVQTDPTDVLGVIRVFFLGGIFLEYS